MYLPVSGLAPTFSVFLGEYVTHYDIVADSPLWGVGNISVKNMIKIGCPMVFESIFQ